jgi:type IV secretion system protein TrbD
MSLRRVPVHRSGIRSHLLLGGDRELVLVTALVAGTLSIATMNLMAAAVGVLLWFLVLGLLRMMAKSDPKLRHVWLRAFQYRNYYPARSTSFRVNRFNGTTPFKGSPWQQMASLISGGKL